MRKRLIFMAVLLILALILAIKTSDGYFPFSRLSEEQLMGAEIGIDDMERTLKDVSELALLAEKLSAMRLGGRGASQLPPIASVTLHTLSGDDFSLTVYNEHIDLDGDCCKADAAYCRDLYELILSLI